MATDELQLTDSYQEVCAGPCLITVEEGLMFLAHIAGSAPAADAPGHSAGTAPGVEGGLSYSGTENVYVKIHPKTKGQPTRVSYTEVL